MRKLAQGIIILLLASTSGCAFVGGFFEGDDCDDQSCETPLLNNPNTREEWFCYATKDGGDWDCVNQEDASKIKRFPTDARPTAVITSLPEIQDALAPAAGPAAETTAVTDPGPDAAPDILAPAATSTEPTSESTPAQYEAVELNPALAPQPETLLASVSAATASASAEKPSSGNEQILQHPRDSWAVQLLALQQENSVVTYAKSNGLNYPLYARIKNQGTEWYILLLGIYSDLSAANIARDEWEKDKNLTTRPWIRRLGPLQDAVRLAGEG